MEQATEGSKVVATEVEFNFRKNKDGLKRETVSLVIPLPTATAIIDILNDTSEDNKKTRSMVLDNVQGIVVQYVRGKVDADDNFNQESLSAVVDELTLDKIANLPRSDRAVITKDELTQFAASYVKLMPELTGISVKSAEIAGDIFIARIRTVVGKNDVLAKLQARLAEYVEKAPNEVVEEHANAINYLVGRLEEALNINIDADAL
jgi:hypothetical protein